MADFAKLDKSKVEPQSKAQDDAQIKPKMTRIMTEYHAKLIPKETANFVFGYLRDNIAWGEGVRSRKGFTRQATPMQLGEDQVLDFIVTEAFEQLKTPMPEVQFAYVNYYRDGNDWCPNHTHPGTKQMVISLGATRQLLVGKKKFPMGNGDVIIFGASLHGVEKEPECKEGRISIALFLNK